MRVCMATLETMSRPPVVSDPKMLNKGRNFKDIFKKKKTFSKFGHNSYLTATPPFSTSFEEYIGPKLQKTFVESALPEQKNIKKSV